MKTGVKDTRWCLVRNAYLSEPVIRAYEPKVLRIASLSGFLLGDNSWGVVRTKLIGTDPCKNSINSHEKLPER